MGKRIGTSILGIPVWAITGISLFLIFSILYDLIVRDINGIRVGLLIGSSLILFITIILHLTSTRFIARVARNQFGA